MRNQNEYDVYAKTGHHWSLTAAAYELNSIFEHFGTTSKNMKYPSVNVVGISDAEFAADKDLLRVQNVIIPKLAKKYVSPELEINTSDNLVYLYGTSYIEELERNLYVDQNNRAFDRLIVQHYYTSVKEYDGNGMESRKYTADNPLDDWEVMRYVNNADLIVLEQQGGLGIVGTHKRFLSQIKDAYYQGWYSVSGSLLRNDNSHIEQRGFHSLEDWGRWMQGNESSVIIHDDISGIEGQLCLKFGAHSFANDQIVDIYWNDELLTTIDHLLDHKEFLFDIPKDTISENDNTVRFVLQNETTSPRILGQSEDARILGLGFTELQIVVVGEE